MILVRQFLAVLAALGLVACASDSRHVDELTDGNYALLVVSLAGTYPFWVAYKGPYWVTIHSMADHSVKGRISSAPVMLPGAHSTVERTHVVNTGGANPGHLHVLRLPAGRYAMREWVIEERSNAYPAPGAWIVTKIPEVRGALDLEFELRPNEVLYLGELVLDEARNMRMADCRNRDISLLEGRVRGLQRQSIRFAQAGKSWCDR